MAQADHIIIPNRRTRLADSRAFYRTFEILPGAITWFFLIAPIVFSFFAPKVVAYFIIAFDLFWLLKSTRMSYGLLRGYSKLHAAKQVNWGERVQELEDLEVAKQKLASLLATKRKYRSGLQRKQLLLRLERIEELLKRRNTLMDPKDIYHAIIMPFYREGMETIGPSIEAILASDYDAQKLMLVLAYEERGGEHAAEVARKLEKKYKNRFGHFFTIQHPAGVPGEIIGKGANITHAGRALLKYVDECKIPHDNVIITTLDSDHRPHKHYFNLVSYIYCTDPNRRHKSFQPMPLFLNNIWDAPAPTRVVATSNSFWVLIEATRPHRLRNFASHAQGLHTLVDTDFWSVNTIVEDGHQYWRTYFTYNGDHMVEPIYLPIYQDAVLSTTMWRTFRAQFVQLQRWAYGVSDIPYVVKNSVKNKEIPLGNRIAQIWRLFEGHFSWATAPLILAFVAWLPLFLNPSFKEQVLAHQLPVVASRILTLAMAGLFITIWISLLSLPPRPARYRRGKYVLMLLQWALSPIVAIVFGSFAAINAQTRLMIGKRLEVFNVTEKVVKK